MDSEDCLKYNLPNIIKDDTISDFEYEHRVKYLNLYIRIIDRCKTMTDEELSDTYERHHILPKCMGGTNDKENLVKMPVRYHIMAHIILVEAYPNNYKLLHPLNFLFGKKDSKSKNIRDHHNILMKHFSTRTVALVKENQLRIFRSKEYRDSISGKNSPNYGKPGKPMSEEQKAMVSKRHKGMKVDPEKIKHWDKHHRKGKDNPRFGTTLPEEQKKQISNTVKNLWDNTDIYKKVRERLKVTGSESYKSKKVVGPDGTVYGSLKEAVEASEIPNTTLRSWMKGLNKSGGDHGWHYLDPKNKLTRKQKKELEQKEKENNKD